MAQDGIRSAERQGLQIAGGRARFNGPEDHHRTRHIVNGAARRQQKAPNQEVLAGLVERVTFHNADNGFCVLRIKARGHRDLVTVVGHAAIVSAGEWVTAAGEWVNDRTHGQQFKAGFMRTSEPSSIDGIEKYLGSGMIHGIGPVYAKKMVKAFGEKVFDIIEAEPERLREVTGIGRVRAKRITDAWAEQKIVREIMVFLHSHGIGTARAVRIYKTYGVDAVQVMTENPYRLARDIRGIGFKTADTIAMKLGIEKTAMIRVRAGISHALTEAMDDGHCGLPAEKLSPLAVELLEVSKELVQDALDLELAEGTVVAAAVAGTPCIFLGGLYRAERVIAERVLRITGGKLPWPDIDAGKALPWVEGKTGLSLAASQAEAVRLALTSKALVITGGPGVGKTTIVNAILRILAAKGVTLLLCAPTGRAAKRMTEATGFEAKTIHRLLEVDPKGGGFKRNGNNPLDCGLLVVDETSMVDVMLMQALLKAVPDTAALLIVGDIDQLPSVGSRPGTGQHHRLRCRLGRAADRGFPSGRAKPDRYQRARDQPGFHSQSFEARGRQRLLLRAGGQSGNRGADDHRIGEDAHPKALRARSDPRHPGTVPDEPRRRRRPLAQHRAAGRPQSGRRSARSSASAGPSRTATR